MIRTSFAVALAAAAFASACATAPQSILLGAGTGAVAGGGAGLAIGGNATGAAIGAATGAITGSLIGFLLNKGKEQDKSTKATDIERYPFLTRPEIRTIVVPDTVEGDRYIEQHRVFVIEKNSSWSKDND